MCLIVDANVSAQFLAQPSAIVLWLLGERGNPHLVAAGKLLEELARNDVVRRLLVQLERAGRLRSADAARLNQEQIRLAGCGLCRSSDHHVLALAIVSGARTLATLDNPLAKDFKNPKLINGPRGLIYRNPASHARLLCHTTASCGIRDNSRRGRRTQK
jgi:hypothetical protein